MTTYKIYPKEGAKDFQLTECTSFEFDGQAFKFYDTYGQESENVFASVDHIAAIIPEGQGEIQGNGRIFLVYLRERKNPIKVKAAIFDRTDPTLSFYWLQHSGGGIEAVRLNNFYVALSEVVAVFPEEGLKERTIPRDSLNFRS